MSRVEKYSRQKIKQQETERSVNLNTDDMERLPPRTKKHISSKQKLTRFYYNLIFIFFLLLVISLFIYGYNYTNNG